MAEFDNRYASNGKGNAGVALGVVGNGTRRACSSR